MRLSSSACLSVVVGLIAGSCAAHPAAPFDTLKTSGVTMLRLQNYEPPAAAAGGATTAAVIPGLPPQIQQWAQQAAPVLQQLLPPGLLPPGLLQGPVLGQQASTMPETFRFHGRRVLGTQEVMNPLLKEELAELLGDPDNFQMEHQDCDYTELGLGWNADATSPPYEILISFSCNHIKAAQGFAWPHASGMGMKPKTVEGLAQIIGELFPRTSSLPPAPPPMSQRSPDGQWLPFSPLAMQ